MVMELRDVVVGRRSIRRYKDKDVPLIIVGEILDIARFAPSSGNVQNWRIVVVTDKDKRQQLADASVDQDWMIEAPVFLVICNQYEPVEKKYGKMGHVYSIQNCAAIATVIALLAKDKGLGTCWVGAFDAEAVQRTLSIPEDVDPEIILTLGYQDEEKFPPLRDDLYVFAYINEWKNRFTNVKSDFEALGERVKNLKKQIMNLKKK